MTTNQNARGWGVGISSFVLLMVLAGCSDDPTTVAVEDPVEDLRTRFGLETLGPIPYPPNNPPRQERIALGRLLFFDPILSGERDVSCGTCHHPAFAFADLRQFGAGTSGSGLGPDRIVSHSSYTGKVVDLEPRNTPTIFNTAFNAGADGRASHMGVQFLDGRVEGLEVQATKPITSRVEMRGDAYPGTDAEAAAATLDSVLARLQAIPEYEHRFRDAFPREAQEVATGLRTSAIDSSTFGRAIAAYERELVTRNTAYDRYVRGDDEALSMVQKRGLELFFNKAKCAACHTGAMFSDFQFVVQGVPQEGSGKGVLPGDDTGREEHTGEPGDRYAFRTLTLRNVALTAPYMHDGVFETLEEVVRFYNNASKPRHPAVTDAMLHPVLRDSLHLTDDEIDAVVAFMRALTDPGTALPRHLVTVPAQVPSGLMPVFGLKGRGSGKNAADGG